MAALSVAPREDKLAIMRSLAPSQVAAVAAYRQMGGRLLPQHAAHVRALSEAKSTSAKRRVQMGGGFQDFADDVDAGIGSFFKSFLDPGVWLPILLAGGATLVTGGAAAPALVAAAGAAAPRIGATVASGVQERRERAVRRALGSGGGGGAQDFVPRQFGVSI